MSLVEKIQRMLPDFMKSPLLTERRGELEARREELADVRDAEVVRLDKLQRRAREEYAAGLVEADAAFEARADELDRSLAADLKKAIYPVVATFVDDPRAAAIQVADLWRALEKRAHDELGDELAGKHLAFAFLATMDDPALARGGVDRFYDQVRAPSVVRVIQAGAGPAAVEAGLRELEVALSKALVHSDVEPDARRVEVLQGRATLGRFMDAARRHDREAEAERKKAAQPAEDARAQAYAERTAALSKRARRPGVA